MQRRRLGRIFVGAFAIAIATAGLGLAGTTGTAGAASDNPADQFKNLKEIKEPSPCKDDPGVTDTEIKIGSITPTSGPSAVFSTILDGIKARFAKANAEGELGKRKLTLVNEDDGADPARNVTAAQKLIEDEKVFAILAESGAGDASGAYLNQQKIPVVGWQLGLPVYGTYTNYFGMQNANVKDIKTHYVARPIEAVKALGAKKIAVIGNSTGNAATFAEQNADSVKRVKGLQLVYKTTDIPPGTTEFGAVVDQIKQSGADTVYTTMATQDGIALVNQLKQAGVTPKIIVFPGGYSPAVLNLPAFDNAYFSLEFAPLETKPEPHGITEFKKWMADTAPDVALGQQPMVGWISANTLIEGIKAAGVNCPTRKAFINNLRLVKGYTADGFFPPMNFTDVYNRPFKCAYYIQVVNHQFVPQFDGKQFCGKIEIRNNKILETLPNETTTVAPTTTLAPS
jgi:branched-chain amino acid transport system substrate-binding protein